ncbi:MAG: hypothetical protein JKY48_11325 [Flavobacteriales bacterium]|nr:hypothetical protein [Flavobacteriales bacterium]
MEKIILYIVLSITFIGNTFSQFSDFYSIEVQQNEFQISDEGSNTYSFNADNFLNNLSPTSNSIEFTYLWSFGDGQYSMEQYPIHIYESGNDVEQYQVVLYATPVYIPLGPPPAAYTGSGAMVTVDPGGNPIPIASTYMTPANTKIDLSYNRLPRASYESTYILTYKNTSANSTASQVEFYFNENYFEYKGAVAPNEEILESNTPINDGNYTRQLTFQSINPIGPGEERTIFIQLYTKTEAMGEMVYESEGEISFKNTPELFVKATFQIGMDVFVDEVSISAVGSWDPNNKISSIQYINRDDISFPETISYRINCENMGTGPTGSVTITDTVSPLLDISSFTYLGDKYSLGLGTDYTVTTDLSNRTITIDYGGLVLEGTNSPNLVSLGTCRHWVDFEFEINQSVFENTYGSSVSCTTSDLIGTFGTNAEIVFDNHAPILTNVASTEVHCEVINPDLRITNVFPNPATNSTTVKYLVSTAITNPTDVHTYLVNVITGTREEIIGLPLNFSTGTHLITLDLSMKRYGSYVFQIEVSGLTFTSSTIVKQ